MSLNSPKLDDRTKNVVAMYSKYPFPFRRDDNYFERFVLPTVVQLSKEYPIRRWLEAGCGTGNVTADMAACLPEVEVMAIDLTDESLALAKERAERKGLKNVSFRKSNLLQHDPGLGVFDFVYCQGVIHHLSDPLAGMKNLNRYLKHGHHAYVWLYSLLGRRRIFDLREALKILGVEDLPWEQKVQLAMDARPLFLSQRLTFVRKVIKVLEYVDQQGIKGLGRYLYSHLTRSPQGMHSSVTVADQYLHPQDKFYRVAEALDLFSASGFALVRVLQGMSNTLDESFGRHKIWNKATKFSQRDSYILMELHEQPEGFGFLIKKTREVAD